MKERGLWWVDFDSLLRRNAVSNAVITYYRDKNMDPLKISVFDRGLPRRKPDANTFLGYGEEDHWKDSFVCATSYFGGEIPMEGSEGYYEGNKCLEKPYRGALKTIEILLSVGSLRRTDELRELFYRHGRRFPKPPEEGMADSLCDCSDVQTPDSPTESLR